MKLWYSETSPYARKVRAVIAYHKLDGQIEFLEATSGLDKNSPHNRDNPLGRIPALQLNNGEWLYNSSLIAQYLDSLGTQPSLYLAGEAHWQALQLHYLADGILENEIAVIPEKRLRPQNEWWLARHQQIFERTAASLPALYQAIQRFEQELNIGTLNAVCAIDFLRLREKFTQASRHPLILELSQWSDEMNAKYPYLQQTRAQ